jgi:hypothetical protein
MPLIGVSGETRSGKPDSTMRISLHHEISNLASSSLVQSLAKWLEYVAPQSRDLKETAARWKSGIRAAVKIGPELKSEFQELWRATPHAPDAERKMHFGKVLARLSIISMGFANALIVIALLVK